MDLAQITFKFKRKLDSYTKQGHKIWTQHSVNTSITN